MKKGAVKISGFLTTVISFILLLCLSYMLCNMYGLITDLIDGLYEILSVALYYPLGFVLYELFSADFELLSQIVIIFFAVFTLLMFIWGIKEMTLAKKDDESFARCKKTCAFMMVLKFIFFLYNLFILVSPFVIGEISLLFNAINLYIGVSYILQIIFAIVSVITFINFLIPVLTFNKASKLLKNSSDFNGADGVKKGKQVPNVKNGNSGEQGKFEGTVYQAPFYSTQQSEPLNPSNITHPESLNEENVISIIPGQNGIPLNITQKGIDDLIRLERLRASGTLDEENYNIMKEKICLTNIS